MVLSLIENAAHAVDPGGKIDVKTSTQQGKVWIEVTDDGCGFDTGDLSKVEGLGLAGMSERAGLAGGTLAVESSPLAGTTISCCIPLHGGDGGRFD